MAPAFACPVAPAFACPRGTRLRLSRDTRLHLSPRHLCLPVPISQALELRAQQAHQRGPQSAAGDQVFHHEGGEQVNVEWGSVQPTKPSKQVNLTPAQESRS